ncbi:alpha/beta fold hydrolase [Bordetella genomosp. 13]|uniref:alpha/beta fold hydrolase n=1 Tax=Bordetella genomosp. 13 TaxID=463040 RepID=UPI0011A6981D|nr:alpha/beta hydrolase [Bordetella genomosp. 13]
MIGARYIEIDGADAYVEHWGEGRPVLCLHTAGQGGWQWKRAAGGLAQRGYQVIVPDLPGHGRSDPALAGPVRDLGLYAAWCESLIDRLGLRDPYVVGCSIGGKIALDLALRRGQRLAGVVAMAADAGLPRQAGESMARGLERELVDAAAPSRSDRTYLGTLAVVGRKVPESRAAAIARMHRREDPEVSTSDLIGWARFDRIAALGGIACPVHMVVGSDDLWMDAERARGAAQAIPGARFTLLDGIGHYPMEELDDAAGHIDGWLKQLEGASR